MIKQQSTMLPKEKFVNGRVYATESATVLNRLRGIRDQLNSMNNLGWDTRRGMANLLYLLEISMVEINLEEIK